MRTPCSDRSHLGVTAMEALKLQKQAPVSALLDPKIVMPAIRAAFVKLDPRVMIKSPVMFVVEVVAALTTIIFLRDLVTGGENLGFTFQIIVWLWFTVLFANFAEAGAETPPREPGEAAGGFRQQLQACLRHQPEGRRCRAGRSRRQHSLRR